MNKDLKKMPTRNELYSESIEKLFKKEHWLRLLNQEPKPDWVKEHPYIKNWKYIPISTIELLLAKIFKSYRIEILDAKLILNAATVTIRLHYIDPTTGEWTFHDGIGCQELQTMQGSGTLKLDMSNLNRGAVQMAFPIAKSYAIKDAADHIGRLFGRDLNRKELLPYEVDKEIDEKYNKIEQDRIKNYIESCKTAEELQGVPYEVVERNELVSLYNEKMQALTNGKYYNENEEKIYTC